MFALLALFDTPHLDPALCIRRHQKRPLAFLFHLAKLQRGNLFQPVRAWLSCIHHIPPLPLPLSISLPLSLACCLRLHLPPPDLHNPHPSAPLIFVPLPPLDSRHPLASPAYGLREGDMLDCHPFELLHVSAVDAVGGCHFEVEQDGGAGGVDEL